MKKTIAILTILTTFIICSCSHNASAPMHLVTHSSIAGESALQTDDQNLNKIDTIGRKIIKQGELRFETKDINKTKSLVTLAVQELNGYIAKDAANDYSEKFEHRLTIRVPAEKFDSLLLKISENVEKLDSKSIDILDVTEEYIDVEARIKTKKELQTRYAELLRQATKVDEILNIEKEMGNLQTELESVEGRMKYLKDRIAFSTLTICYYQKTTSAFGFSSKFADGIRSGWDVFLWFIVGISNLWVIILILFIAGYLFRLWRKKKKNVS